MSNSFTKCDVCFRKAEGNGSVYCRYHSIAYANLQECYHKWKESIVEIEWNSYLEKIITLKATGDWAREVAKQELYSGRTKA